MTYELFGTSQLSAVPLWVQSQLLKLMFRWQSPMRIAFHKIRSGEWAGKVVYAIEGEKVLAWGLYVWKDPESNGSAAPEIMLYCRRSHRGQGLAEQVFWGLRHSIHPNATYVFYGHDAASTAFYMKMYEKRAAGTFPTPHVRWIKQ